MDYMMYYNADTPEYNLSYADMCLDPTEMNYYSSEGIPNVINIHKPSNKDFVSILIDAGFWQDQDTGYDTYYHTSVIRYGVKHPQLDVPGPWSP